jgi:hypothetical protein
VLDSINHEALASITVITTTQSIPTELLNLCPFFIEFPGPWRNWHTQLPQGQPFCGFKVGYDRARSVSGVPNKLVLVVFEMASSGTAMQPMAPSSRLSILSSRPISYPDLNSASAKDDGVESQ